MRPRVKIEVDEDSTAISLMDGEVLTQSADVQVRMSFDWDEARTAVNDWDRVSAQVRDQISALIPAGEAERKRRQGGDLR